MLFNPIKWLYPISSLIIHLGSGYENSNRWSDIIIGYRKAKTKM
jgi:hypothetical protein